jgi:hypothetical protein
LLGLGPGASARSRRMHLPPDGLPFAYLARVSTPRQSLKSIWSTSKIQSCTARLPGLGESPIQIEFAPGLKPLAFVGRATRQLSPDRGDNGGKLKKDIYRLHRKLPTFAVSQVAAESSDSTRTNNLHFVLLHQTIYRHNLTFVTCADSNGAKLKPVERAKFENHPSQLN